jgi:hypothetical protein
MRIAALLSIVLAAVVCSTAAFAVSFNGFVVAAPDGTVIRGTGYTVFHVTTGQYEVDTVPDVHSCAYSITAGSGDTTVPPVSIATAVGRRESRTAIMVATFDSAGQYADEGFHLIVRCLNGAADGAAVVDPDGTLVRGISATSAIRLDTGSYNVTFDYGKISDTCAYTASVGLSGTSGTSEPGFVNVAAVSGGTIAVRTYDKMGNPVDRGFHVFAACNL